MNFYVCSTVRHLLFSILKALSEKDEQHRILFFADYQRTSLDGWDLAGLPNNIRVFEGNRRQFRTHLTRNWSGKLFYFLAMRNFIAPVALHTALFDTLDQFHPELSREFRSAANRHLWLFNERNKMARVFRLVTQDFALIEEGSANYHYRKCPWWRWPGRILLGRPYNQLSIGEDHRCREIRVSYPDQVPPFVRAKAKQIDFLDTPESKAAVRNVFAGVTDFEKFSESIIVATSPLDEEDCINKRQKIELYTLVIDVLASMGHSSLLKLHPRENLADYRALTSICDFVPEKLPLEVFIMLCEKPVTILSFFTSAGIGLEPYFRLIELCERSEATGYNEIEKLEKWLAQPDTLEALIREKVSRL